MEYVPKPSSVPTQRRPVTSFFGPSGPPTIIDWDPPIRIMSPAPDSPPVCRSMLNPATPDFQPTAPSPVFNEVSSSENVRLPLLPHRRRRNRKQPSRRRYHAAGSRSSLEREASEDTSLFQRTSSEVEQENPCILPPWDPTACSCETCCYGGGLAKYYEPAPQREAGPFDKAAYFVPLPASPVSEGVLENGLAVLSLEDWKGEGPVWEYRVLLEQRAEWEGEEIERTDSVTGSWRDGWECDFCGKECFCWDVSD